MLYKLCFIVSPLKSLCREGFETLQAVLRITSRGQPFGRSTRLGAARPKERISHEIIDFLLCNSVGKSTCVLPPGALIHIFPKWYTNTNISPKDMIHVKNNVCIIWCSPQWTVNDSSTRFNKKLQMQMSSKFLWSVRFSVRRPVRNDKQSAKHLMTFI